MPKSQERNAQNSISDRSMDDIEENIEEFKIGDNQNR